MLPPRAESLTLTIKKLGKTVGDSMSRGQSQQDRIETQASRPSENLADLFSSRLRESRTANRTKV